MLYTVTKAEAPASLASFPCMGWVELTDTETGDKAIGAVLHRSGFIAIPQDPSSGNIYGIEITAADDAETIAAAKALFA